MSALLAPSYIDSWFKYDLTLMSRTKCGVSKGGQQSRCIPSFETHAFGVLLRMRLCADQHLMKVSSCGREHRGAGAVLNRALRTPWGLVGLLVAAGIVAAFHVGKVPPSIPSIREELGAGLSQAGWLLSIVNLITALGGTAIALSADRFVRRGVLLLGSAPSVAGSGLGAFAGSVDALVVERFFEGLG